MSTAQARAAVRHHVERVYEATRDVLAAYAVDTGDARPAVTGLPAWADLTAAEQARFVVASNPAFQLLLDTVLDVGERRLS